MHTRFEIATRSPAEGGGWQVTWELVYDSWDDLDTVRESYPQLGDEGWWRDLATTGAGLYVAHYDGNQASVSRPPSWLQPPPPSWPRAQLAAARLAADVAALTLLLFASRAPDEEVKLDQRQVRAELARLATELAAVRSLDGPHLATAAATM
ncbi:MAG: hypothetical protein IT204_08795 [Fimbriimonadaceae bacterium]|nr:hypothetical protein [Fimbriimonadaceae bacterium]